LNAVKVFSGEGASLKFAEYINGYGVGNVEDRIVLESDINLEGYVLTGTIGNEDYAFRGVFEGNGHVIRNFSLDTSVVVEEGETKKTEPWGWFVFYLHIFFLVV